MTITPLQRRLFIKDIEDAFESLCLNMSHLEHKESLDEIITILHSLRIAANVYGEYTLQKNVQEVLALMINHQNEHNTQIVSQLYTLVDAIVYPYREKSMLSA